MRVYGLIGYPLTHSFSKKYFTEKFEKLGLADCSYENFSIASITDVKKILTNNPFLKGLNVTIPYKESVLALLDEKSDVVKKISACNCIKIVGDKLKGFNTDTIGFEKTLITKLKPHHKKALILGTGGAAKAVEFVLLKLGIAIKYVSRKPSVRHFSYEQLTPAVIEEHTLIINATPLGMYPNIVQAPPIPYEALTSRHFLYDLIYNPAKTLFLKKGEQMGSEILNGNDMLIIQAEESWNIWNS
ncbi:MAG: shikimate dehydrogenase [Chitinophagaceae bacterium]|nr:shikimate dehydrogenase [Chitinophagaceae bacterium]